MRPRIVCHMITSLDGKLLSQRWNPSPGQPEVDFVEHHYEATAATLGGEGWIVGRRTMSDYLEERRVPERPSAQAGVRACHHGAQGDRHLAVLFDPAGRLWHESPTLEGDHVLAVLAESVDDAYLQHLRAIGVSYTFAGADGRSPERALASLRRDFGVSCLLLEGGGRLNGAFMAAGLIDEVSTLICPVVDGVAGLPSIYDHQADAGRAMAGLKLISNDTRADGVVWLRHEVLLAEAGSPDEPS